MLLKCTFITFLIHQFVTADTVFCAYAVVLSVYKVHWLANYFGTLNVLPFHQTKFKRWSVQFN
jgi:hypothetical protein